ncbi:hypothetical protein ACFFSW_30780 [Saccharothrix longispora]|uniref:Copper(I)-binding protein n=1 Tax=Saccharothrix longispora TaxID=33920 RepID=A0ABU1PUG9_9PSEU|nr:hypothetical protein [Saccharothrix longispora]MDR6594288.1 copper(I)-binding protein [Saccharothrix longispora]
MTRIGTCAVGIGLCLVVVARGLGPLSGPAGAEGRVGDIALRAVHVVAEDAAPVRPGDDVVVRFLLSGRHGVDDELVVVDSDGADRVELRWDRECDGVAEPATALPLEHGAVPGAGGGPRYHVVLRSLRDGIAFGDTVTVRFGFAGAGDVAVPVPLVASRIEERGHCSDLPATPSSRPGGDDASADAVSGNPGGG